MQPEVFVVKHTADVRIIEYTLLGSLNRIAFFLNNFFEDIDLCCRSIFLVINEQKNNLSIGSVNRTVSRLCFLFFASYLCADFISAYK